MKKFNLSIALLTVAGSLLASNVALAGPNVLKFRFICPKATGHSSTALVHNGKSIQGYGTEFFQDKRTAQAPFFTTMASANIPANLSKGGYSSTNTGYNIKEGEVTCWYESSLGYDSFHVDYTFKYGSGGMVTSSSPTSITISKFVG